jgi:hypothetical protein
MKTIQTYTPAQALLAADTQGLVEISAGLWLWSREAILVEAASWDEDDLAKTTNFSSEPYWLTDDAGMKPLPVYGADDQDLIDALQ